jgi:hypothetical protein
MPLIVRDGFTMDHEVVSIYIHYVIGCSTPSNVTWFTSREKIVMMIMNLKFPKGII